MCVLYNLKEAILFITQEFERSSWPCAVCFTDKPGTESFKFYDCGHIYCKECMKGHFTVRIQEGEVNQLTCPEDKCESQGHPSQVCLLAADWLRYTSAFFGMLSSKHGTDFCCQLITAFAHMLLLFSNNK